MTEHADLSPIGDRAPEQIELPMNDVRKQSQVQQQQLADSARRLVLSGIAVGAASAATAGCASSHVEGKTARKTFVLIHGAWRGGWCWRRVADRLEARGHKVYAPSLTGLADRSHLLSTSLTLQTHIDDVVNLFLWEDIQGAVLVAHSCGGWPVSAALEKLEGRVSSVVFVDAFVPDSGQRVLDTNAPQFQQVLLDAIARGEPGRPVPKVEQFNVLRKEDAARVQSKMTQQPTGVATSPTRPSGARDRVAKKDIHSRDWIFESSLRRLPGFSEGKVLADRRPAARVVGP